MIWNRVTRLLNQLHIPGFFAEGNHENNVYLTLDDGPNRNTSKLFEFLDGHKIAATHFWLFNGENDNFYINKSNLQRIAVHGWNHVRYSRLNEKETEAEITNCISKATELNLHYDNYLRTPYGSMNKYIGSVAKKKKLKQLYWSHILDDYKTDFDPASVRKLLKGIRPGSIIVVHDKEIYFNRVCQTVRNIQDIVLEQNLKLTCLPY